MSLPIGFFAPLPLPMMIPFMGIQSAVMAEQFGTMFQYGKRRISAMSNEQFNELTFEKLQSEMTTQLKGMIPEMKQQIQAMQPLVEAIIHEFGNYIRLAGSELRNAIETGRTQPRQFNLTINQVETLAKETNTNTLLQLLIDMGIIPSTPTEGQLAGATDLDPITSHNIPIPKQTPIATDPTTTYIPGSTSVIEAEPQPIATDTAGISVGHETTEGKMLFASRYWNEGEATMRIKTLYQVVQQQNFALTDCKHRVGLGAYPLSHCDPIIAKLTDYSKQLTAMMLAFKSFFGYNAKPY